MAVEAVEQDDDDVARHHESSMSRPGARLVAVGRGKPGERPATEHDVHAIAGGMPFVTLYDATSNPIYQVGGKSFVFFRNPRPDAVDPDTGERYDDVIVFWVDGDQDKQALLQSGSPYFTTR